MFSPPCGEGVRLSRIQYYPTQYLPGKYGGRELEGGGLHIKRAFKDVVAQFIGQMRLMNQATTER